MVVHAKEEDVLVLPQGLVQRTGNLSQLMKSTQGFQYSLCVLTKMSLRYVEWSRSVQSRRWFSLWNWITAVWWTATDDVYFNTSHHNISIHLLLTLLHTFLLALMRRIRLMIKASFIGHHYLYSHDFNEWFSILIMSGETRCWSLIEFKGLIGYFCYLFWLSVHQCLKHPSPCEE